MLIAREEVNPITAEQALDVVDEPDQQRLAVHLDGAMAELGYRLRGQRLLLIHTEVPSALEGHGIGGSLVRAAVERAARDGLTVVPHCRFANAWLRRHPDVAAAVEIAWPRDDELS